MKKKILALALVVVLAVTAVTGATLAYFTDTDKDINVMTTGNVKIIQNENDAEGGKYQDGQKLIPSVEDEAGNPTNNVIEKYVTVTNKGSEDAYVRTFILCEANQDDETGYVSTDFVWFDTNVDDYTGYALGDEEGNLIYVDVDGIPYEVWMYVYDSKLPAEQTTPASLQTVWLDAETTQEDMPLIMGEDGKYSVIVFSQAVQAAGFDTADEAFETAYVPYDEINAGHITKWVAEANAETQGY